jgi:hypothetical protein
MHGGLCRKLKQRVDVSGEGKFALDFGALTSIPIAQNRSES